MPPLNPNLHVYFEYSNEVWNFGFGQATANENAALAEAATGTSPINYDGLTDPYQLAIRRIVEQTVNDSNIFRSVFGSASMGTEIRPVYEFQYNNLSNTAQVGLDFLNNYYNNADGIQHVSQSGAAELLSLGHWRRLVLQRQQSECVDHRRHVQLRCAEHRQSGVYRSAMGHGVWLANDEL